MARLGLATEAIDRRLETIADVLNSPAVHLHVLKRELRLDRMNVIAENEYAREGTTIELRLASVQKQRVPSGVCAGEICSLRSAAGAVYGR